MYKWILNKRPGAYSGKECIPQLHTNVGLEPIQVDESESEWKLNSWKDKDNELRDFSCN